MIISWYHLASRQFLAASERTDMRVACNGTPRRTLAGQLGSAAPRPCSPAFRLSLFSSRDSLSKSPTGYSSLPRLFVSNFARFGCLHYSTGKKRLSRENGQFPKALRFPQKPGRALMKILLTMWKSDKMISPLSGKQSFGLCGRTKKPPPGREGAFGCGVQRSFSRYSTMRRTVLS